MEVSRQTVRVRVRRYGPHRLARQHDVDTVTLAGYMTNNCVLASAVEAEFLGFSTEVLSDATGAINLANDAGFADAKTVHTTLLTLLTRTGHDSRYCYTDRGAGQPAGSDKE